MKSKNKRSVSGYTLIEMIVVVTVIGILASVAIRSLGKINDASRLEQTRDRMEQITAAICGNTAAVSGGGRNHYGYVGDNGCLPSTLDELILDSHGYPTWDGPYISEEIADLSGNDYFKQDFWGQSLVYSGLEIVSTGSGTTITTKIAPDTAALLYNSASFAFYDLNYTPPGSVYKDSVEFNLRIPRNGYNVNLTKSPDAGGYVRFDSIPVGVHFLEVIYTPENDTMTRRININPASQYYADIQYPLDIWTGVVTVSDTILAADFDSDSEGFAYTDDPFRGTSKPHFASGVRQASGGYSGGALQVSVGGVNNGNITGMSGGWSIDFNLPSQSELVLTFWYKLTQTSEYESDEYSEVLAAVDGSLYGAAPNDYIERITGNGPGGAEITTGWQSFQVNLGTLSAGMHNLVIGEYNNKKTTVNESTELLIDNVSLTAP